MSGIYKEIDVTLSTPLPPQNVMLKVTTNKVKFIEVLITYILDNVPSSYEKKLIITGRDPIPRQVTKGVVSNREDLVTKHEEADVNIPRQLMHAISEGSTSALILCDDFDVLALLLHHLFPFERNVSVLMDTPKSQDRAVIDVMKTGRTHVDIVPNLLAMHCLSGCDTVPQLFGIGKKTALKVVKRHPLPKLGDCKATISEVMSEAKLCIAPFYGVNDFSTTTFEKMR